MGTYLIEDGKSGFLGMTYSDEGVNMLNFLVSGVVSHFTPPPPPEIQALVENIRVPGEPGEPHEISA